MLKMLSLVHAVAVTVSRWSVRSLTKPSRAECAGVAGMDGIDEVVSQDHDGSKEADGPFNGAI
jgi:hypothetical protein